MNITVELIDSMGNDLRIVNCARVSYGKESLVLSKEDEGLLDYLVRETHTSPIESVKFTFRIKAPIFVLRQVMRSRTGVFNEVSGRYVQLEQEYFLPKKFYKQSTLNHQGRSSDEVEDSDQYQKRYELNMQSSFDLYNEAISSGVSKEQARVNLPVATFSEVYWTIDAHNLLHFLKTRLDSHAQEETRYLAQLIADHVEKVIPVTFKAWKFNVFNGVHLNEAESDFFYYLLNQYATEEVISGHLDKRQIRILKEKMDL